MCSLRTTLSLQFKPETIAAAAVLLAMKLHRMPTKLVDGKHWLLHRMCAVKPSPVEGAVQLSIYALSLLCCVVKAHASSTDANDVAFHEYLCSPAVRICTLMTAKSEACQSTHWHRQCMLLCSGCGCYWHRHSR